MGLTRHPYQLHAMGVYSTTWGETYVLEANKFWFLSLMFSISLGWVHYFAMEEEVEELLAAKVVQDSHMPSPPPKRESKRPIVRRFIADAFDLFIPGGVTGWLPSHPAWVGFAMVVSTVLSSKDIWDRLQ